MSLHPQDPPAVPEETSRVARAAFPKGTLCLRIADAFGPVYRDGQFAALFPRRGRPAEAPGRLALATVLQFVENLSDREAADAVRGRIDWKYALGLALTDPGFDHTVLSEFRTRLVAGGAELLLLDTLLERLKAEGVVKARGRQRTNSTHMLAAVRTLNRLERVGETLRAALNELAVKAPDWLQAMAPAVWYERYGRRVENYRLPKTEAARSALAAEIGADGRHLLAALDAADRPELVELPKVAILRRVWAAQYVTEKGRMRLGEAAELPPSAEQVCSPYDPDARNGTKREADWIGYKAQLTETCDPACEWPHFIINVETTPATTPNDNMVAVVHASLKRRGLLPGEHLVDKGYTDSHVLVDSKRQHDVTIIGPVADDPSWQAHVEGGLTKAAFRVDWEHRVVTCPAGKESISWLPHTWRRGSMVHEARFARRDCTPCPLRPRCTRAKREPRIVSLQAREHFEALQGARRHQETEAFRASYAARAGVEGTHSQTVHRCGFRAARGVLRDDAEAEDVVQEAYVRAFQGLAGFRGEAGLSTWLTRIAYNEALGRLRRRRTAVALGLVDAAARGGEGARILMFPTAHHAGGSDPESAAARRELRRLLEGAIDALPGRFRVVLVARDVDGISVEETAETLGLRPETVRTRLHRARRLLRTALEERLGDPLRGAFPFDGVRCSRLTEAVMARLGSTEEPVPPP